MGVIVSLFKIEPNNQIIKAIKPFNYRYVVGFNFDKVTNQYLWDQRIINFHTKIKRTSIDQSFIGLRININDNSEFMIKLTVSKIELDKINLFYETCKQFINVVSFYYECNNELFFHQGEKYLIIHINKISIPLRPNSFTQANHEMGNILYKKINSVTNPNHTLICYGRNCFHIASQIEHKFKKIICINPCEIAYEDGYELMRIYKYAWLTYKTREELYLTINNSNENTTIIISPGRSGYCYFDEINLEKLRNKQFIYITCNEETLKKDIKNNFKIKKNIMIELFPNTEYNEHIYELEIN
jgi:hypothetical protein